MCIISILKKDSYFEKVLDMFIFLSLKIDKAVNFLLLSMIIFWRFINIQEKKFI